MLANNFGTSTCFAIFELIKFMYFGSTFNYHHKEFLLLHPPRTRTHSSAGFRTRPANEGTPTPGVTRPREALYSTIRSIATVE